MIWTGTLIVICLIGAFAYYRQLRYGLVVTNMGDYVSWGIYISNFVFLCCYQSCRITDHCHISSGQCKMEHTTYKNRRDHCSICHRVCFPDHYCRYGPPGKIGESIFTHGRIQSPIMWDVIVIGTYLFISLLLFYFPLLPDLKITDQIQGSRTQMAE